MTTEKKQSTAAVHEGRGGDGWRHSVSSTLAACAGTGSDDAS